MFAATDLLQHFNTEDFQQKSLEIFRFQAENNPIYRGFIKHLGINPNKVTELEKIPFLPIDFFKDFEILTLKKPIEKVFTSSGTTGMIPSKHFVYDLSLYHSQLEKSFEFFYGNFNDYVILPLLPAYAERQGSSLIEMVDFWMQKTGQQNREYFLYDHEKLAEQLRQYQLSPKKVILIGVSFALLDFAENYKMNLSDCIIIETGGMKGRKAEMTRNELHEILKNAFSTSEIQSEYGMTELLSQAYAKESGLFESPPWMKILLRDPEDPFSYVKQGKSGGINVIDFANINSCSFIATEDLGRFHTENKLEILGRFDNSDVRGCNLMVV